MADIKLKDSLGIERTYTGIDRLVVPESTSGTVEYIIPEGSITITDNGTVNVANYATAVVNTPIKEEETFSVTPSTVAQTITPTTGKVFSSGTVAAMPEGTLGTVSASKTISGNTATITPSISAGTAGYNAMAGATGNAVTVAASELVSGSLTLTTNTTADVTNYATVTTNIESGVVEVDSAVTMDTNLSTKAVGMIYEYTGTDTTAYKNGRLYRIIEEA